MATQLWTGVWRLHTQVTYTAVHVVSHKTLPTYQRGSIEKQEKNPQTSKPLFECYCEYVAL